MGAAGHPEPPITHVCLNFNCIDIQSGRADIILSTFKEIHDHSCRLSALV